VTAPGAGIPEDVYRFLYQNIESVEQLELLMLLFQAPERGWSPVQVAEALASHRSSVSRRLEAFLLILWAIVDKNRAK
jgi:hypothetical protein